MRRVFENEFILDADEHGEFCVIPLSGRRGNFFAKIDVEDFERVKPFRWHRSYMRTADDVISYAARCRPRTAGGRKTRVYMHRELMGVTDGKILIDHRNGDGLDNRRFNLRFANKSQNNWNQRIRSGGTSRYKGIHWSTRDAKWYAKIKCHRKWHYIGSFESKIIDGVDAGELAAAKAYDLAAVKYFGVFARLNFGDGNIRYVLNRDEVGKARALLRSCDTANINLVTGWLEQRTIEELDILCRFAGCNISRLAGELVSKEVRR